MSFSFGVSINMKDKIYDIVLFVGGITLALGLFSTYKDERFLHFYYTNWVNMMFMIIGVAMIVMGFVRRSWKKNEDK